MLHVGIDDSFISRVTNPISWFIYVWWY